MKIKVCGLGSGNESAEIAAMENVDLLGFIFYGKSKRFTATTAPSIGKERVGVFVNAEEQTIESAILSHSLTMLQLHGDESPGFCRKFQGKIRLIKAFGIGSEDDFSKTGPYEGIVDYFLFDSKSIHYGGTGAGFNWEILDNYTGLTPFFLSGGIGPESIDALKKVRHPLFAGIDLNSRFETVPGTKNPQLIYSFIQSFKQL